MMGAARLPGRLDVAAENGRPVSVEGSEVAEVICRYAIEGRWWQDGCERIYYRVEFVGGGTADLYHEPISDRWEQEA